MVLLLTKAQRKPFNAATVGALSMSLIGAPFAAPASFAVESPAPQQITAAQAQQVQGIPGQYQIRHSKNGKIFMLALTAICPYRLLRVWMRRLSR